MGKNQSASGLTNVIQYNNGNITFVSGSTTLMSISSSGAITTTGVISGSNVLTASYANNAELLDGLDSTAFATTGAYSATSGSLYTVSSSAYATSGSLSTASGSFNTRVSALEATGSALSSSILSVSSSAYATSGSLSTDSGSFNSRVASLETYSTNLTAKTASFATTGSNTFIGSQVVSGSLTASGSITATGTITAQTLVVQTITSSVVYSSGSNVFGNDIGNSQRFTGSVLITGSLTIAGGSSATSYSGATVYGSTAVCSPVGLFSGCVGIGVTEPTLKLDVRGTLGIPAISGTSQYGYLRLTSNAGSSRTLDFGGYDSGRNYAMWMQATDWADLSVNSSLIINPNGGNVGIGTCTPSQKLEVAGVIRGEVVNVYGSTDPASTSPYLYSPSTGALGIGANGSERMRITSGGYVGIGTCTPNNTLQVVNSQINGGIYNTNSSGDSIGMIPFQRNNANDFFGLCRNGQMSLFASPSCSNVFSIGTQNASDIVFGTNDVIRMRITSTGIACFACQVCAPNIISSGTICSTGNACIGGATVIAGCLGIGTLPNQSGTKLQVAGVTDIWSSANTLLRLNHDGTRGVIETFTGGGYSSTAINPNGGNVGIGTTSPNQKFNVVTTALGGRQNMAAIDRTAQNFVTFTNPEYSVDASMGLLLRVFPQSDARQGAGIIASGGGANGDTNLDLFVSTGSTSSVSYSALSIKSSGNVGIGLTNPSCYYANQLVVSAGSEGGITIANPTTTGAQYIMFADGTSGADRYRGYMSYNHTDNNMTLATDATTRFIITGTGVACFACQVCAKSLWFSSNTTGQITFGANDACNPYIVSDSNNSLYLGNNNSYKILIPQDGGDMMFRTSPTYANPQIRLTITSTGIACFAYPPQFPGANLICSYTCTFASYCAGCWYGLFAGDNGYNGAYAFTVVGQLTLNGSLLYSMNYSTVPYIHKSTSIESTNGNNFYALPHTSAGHADNGTLVCFRRARYSGNSPVGNRTEFCMDTSYNSSFTATTYVLAWV